MDACCLLILSREKESTPHSLPLMSFTSDEKIILAQTAGYP